MSGFTAPELPTRAEREFEREFDAMEHHFRERDFAAVLKNAQALVIQAHSLAIFGRQGVDAIPVDTALAESGRRFLGIDRAPDGFSYSDPAIVVGYDSPAGAGDSVEADRE